MFVPDTGIKQNKNQDKKNKVPSQFIHYTIKYYI